MCVNRYAVRESTIEYLRKTLGLDFIDTDILIQQKKDGFYKTYRTSRIQRFWRSRKHVFVKHL